MEKVVMQANRKYRLEKVQEVKEKMLQTKIEKIINKVVFWFVVSSIVYFGIHFVIYLVRVYQIII